MSDRSPRASADLIISELKGMLDHYEYHLEPHVAERYNNALERMEQLLGEDLPQLCLDHSSVFNDFNTGSPLYDMSDFRSKCRAALDYLLASQYRRPAILDKRYEVLATLIDAYLTDDSEFLVRKSPDGRSAEIIHPGLDDRYMPAWTHLRALANEGHLDLQEGKIHSTIGIPSQVLSAYRRGGGIELGMPAGERRIQAIKESPTTYHYVTVEGSANFAYESSNVQQAARVGVLPGDRDAFIGQLKHLGLTEDDVEGISAALDEDEADAGQRTFGERAREWVGDYSARTVEATSIAAVVELVKAYVG